MKKHALPPCVTFFETKKNWLILSIHFFRFFELEFELGENFCLLIFNLFDLDERVFYFVDVIIKSALFHRQDCFVQDHKVRILFSKIFSAEWFFVMPCFFLFSFKIFELKISWHFPLCHRNWTIFASIHTRALSTSNPTCPPDVFEIKLFEGFSSKKCRSIFDFSQKNHSIFFLQGWSQVKLKKMLCNATLKQK